MALSTKAEGLTAIFNSFHLKDTGKKSCHKINKTSNAMHHLRQLHFQFHIYFQQYLPSIYQYIVFIHFFIREKNSIFLYTEMTKNLRQSIFSFKNFMKRQILDQSIRIYAFADHKNKCSVRGRGVERRPRNLEVLSSIPGSRSQLQDFFTGQKKFGASTGVVPRKQNPERLV